MNFAEYVALPGANFSTLKEMARSPFHYHHRTRVPRKDNATLMRGRASHVATLEPHKFADEYAIWTGARRQGKAWDEFEAASVAAGQSVLKDDEAQQALSIAHAVRFDPYASLYLKDGDAEQTILWTDAATGIECKGRIDFVSRSVRAHVDLKTSRDASPDGFGRACARYLYHAQAAFYVDGYAAVNGGEVLPFAFVAVEPDEPHVVQVYRVPEHVLDIGRELYRGWLETLARCRDAGSWPMYAEGELELVLPRWAGGDDEDGDVSGLGLEWTDAIDAAKASGKEAA